MSSRARYERYAFEASPWVQDLNQRDLAELLGTTKGRLETIIAEKDKYTNRRTVRIGSKDRQLAVPVGRLRTVHERLKFHLNKVKQPEYLFSPRKGRGQRDNAEYHAGQNQFLGLDIKQFYPSTTQEHIFRWAYHVAGLKADVAGMFAKLVAIDGKMPFGSPVSPVLTTHVHRAVFDEIFGLCRARELRMSLWVDDLTISGTFVTGQLLEQVRSVIRRHGFQTHKIQFKTGARTVDVTGVPIRGKRIDAPRALHKRIQDGYGELRQPLSDAERVQVMDRLLSALGTYRYHLGRSSPEGRKAADRMQALRQRRGPLKPVYITGALVPETMPAVEASDEEVPWA
ncbi:MAG TPA: reverse transcriptase family protein [Allosphingosinicella sp.]